MGNDFEKLIVLTSNEGLYSLDIEILQVNLGFLCNQQCIHCHLESSPERKEVMQWPVMEMILKVVRDHRFKLIDLTGGAPELNPYFRLFVASLSQEGLQVQVRTNLTAILESGKDMPDFLCKNKVRLVASLPCYLEENVRAQRGEGVYEKSISVIKRLNDLGYGYDSDLPLTLVYNPFGAYLPPPQSVLEDNYRRELESRFRITFTKLITITNMPLGRFRRILVKNCQLQNYMENLKKSFNPLTLEGLMCRHQISVGWDGILFDCDFNLSLGLSINHGALNHISSFNLSRLSRRRIITGEHCFGCTAGAGSSCSGALI